MTQSALILMSVLLTMQLANMFVQIFRVVISALVFLDMCIMTLMKNVKVNNYVLRFYLHNSLFSIL